MVGKRIFELFPIEKKLVWPNQALGRHIGFWWITQNATRCQPGTARDLHLEPIWNTNHQKPGGGVIFKGEIFFNGPASGLNAEIEVNWWNSLLIVMGYTRVFSQICRRTIQFCAKYHNWRENNFRLEFRSDIRGCRPKNQDGRQFSAENWFLAHRY